MTADDRLDLPLGGRPAREPVPGDPTGGADRDDAGDAGGGRARRGGRGLGLLFILLLVALGVVAGYLLPRRSPPVARSSAPLLDFSEQRVGTASAPRDLLLTNGGERTLEVATVRVVGAAGTDGGAAGDFGVAADGCSGTRLAGDAPCALRVGFTPQAPGVRRARLEIAGNAANAPLSIPLEGTGVAPELTADPAVLDFGEVPVGTAAPAAVLTLRNPGTAPLAVKAVLVEGAAAADFIGASDRCSGALLAPGATCTLGFTFAPTLAGERRASLRVWSDAAGEPPAIELAGVGRAPRIAAEPAAVDFGEVATGGAGAAGAAGAAATVRLRNPGERPVEVAAIRPTGPGGPFAVAADRCSGVILAPAGTCAVEVGFAPTAEGPATGGLEVLLKVDGNGGGGVVGGEEVGDTVALTGIGVSPRLIAEPGRVDFGAARIGGAGVTAAERTVTLSNRGTVAVALGEAAVTGADRAAFTKGRDACSGKKLAPGARCVVGVGFRPAREGDHRAELVLRARGAGGPPAVDLSGTGVAPRLEVAGLAGDAVAFGEVPVGSAAERRIELSNPGTAPLTVRAVRAGGDFAVTADGCTGALAPAGRCAITLRFAPGASGDRSGELAIDSDAPGGARRIPLRGGAQPPPEPAIRLSARALRFGEQAVGGRSGIVDLRIGNPGSARLVVSEVTLAGAAAGDYRIVPGSCGVPGFVAPGGDCTLGLRFTPTAPGPRAARLVVRHNAAGGTASVELAGVGSAAPAD